MHFLGETRQLVVYVLILIVFLFALNAKVDSLKTEINTVVRVSCLSGQQAQTVQKYDDQVHAQIDSAETALTIDLRRNDKARARNAASLVARLRSDLIVLPHQDCSKPLLK